MLVLLDHRDPQGPLVEVECKGRQGQEDNLDPQDQLGHRVQLVVQEARVYQVLLVGLGSLVQSGPPDQRDQMVNRETEDLPAQQDLPGDQGQLVRQDSLDSPDRLVVPDQQDHQDQSDRLGMQDLRDELVVLANQETLETPDLPDQRAPLVQTDNQETSALPDRQVMLDLQDQPEHRDPSVQLEQLVFPEDLARLVFQEERVSQEMQALREHKVIRETRGLKDLQVPRGH